MKIIAINGKLSWAIAAFYITENRKFKSVSGIEYKARISGDTIFYNGGSRNGGGEEFISKEEFSEAFDRIKSVKYINPHCSFLK